MKHTLTLITALLLAPLAALHAAGKPAQYEATWSSLDARPTPSWYPAAKFGIFIHWGVYSVPAWGPKGQYAEWYWSMLKNQKSDTAAFHQRVYGPDFKYEQFAPLFKAELFDPDRWADVFAHSGARYVVLTSKHHEGFCLWPSAQSPGWNAMETGPHRDLLGDLTTAVRKRGLKMGCYYSLYEWYHPLYLTDVSRYVSEHMIPQFKDLVTRYQPALIFADGEWGQDSATWRSPELLAWLFNEAPNRQEVVINDRWGKDCRSVHGGYFTTEYGNVGEGKELASGHPWEECRGMGASFGHNRNEGATEYRTTPELIALLAQLVSRGGNLLLNIGPAADGTIPVIMEERLLAMGEWLKVNGEAIYDTQPWWAHAEQDSVFYTRQGDVVYAILTKWPTASQLRLHHPKPTAATRARMVGTDLEIPVTGQGEDLLLDLSAFRPDTLPCAHTWVIRLTNLDTRHIRFLPAWECFAVEGHVKVSAHADWSGKAFDQDTVVRYTLDGNEPTADSPVCSGSVTLTRSATLRAACFRNAQRVSPVFSAPYLVTPFDISPALDTAPPRPDTFLGDLTPVSAVTGWRKVTADSSADGTPLNINGVTFDKGMGVHSRAELVYALKPGYKQFVARVGIHGKSARGSVQVEAWVGKLRVHRSPVLRGGTKPWNIAVDLPPDADSPLRLLVLDAGDGGAYDLTDLGDAGFITTAKKK
jgi:alpha-L-fucosidase